jgi:uncharacterized protein DUF3788
MPSSLTDQRRPPDDAALHAVLGASRRAWDAILAALAPRDGLTPQWKFYAGGHGWQLQIRDRKSTVLYLIPGDGRFVAALALNDAAVAALADSGLPADVIRAIEAAKPAMEGRPARIEVTGARQVATVTALLGLKLASRQPAAVRRTAQRPRRPKARR